MGMAWAKTDADGGRHALVAHSLDVAAVFGQLLLLPILRRRVDPAADRALQRKDIARLSALVFLHDIGKLHPGFQAMGLPDLPAWPAGHVSHSAAGGGYIESAARCSGHPSHDAVTRIGRWGEGVGSLLLAIFAHHGRPVRPGYALRENWPAVRACASRVW